MPALAGEPWRAAADIQLDEALGTRHFWATLRAIGNPAPGEPTGDQTDWEGNPGASFTVRVEWSTTGTPTNGVSATITVRTYLPGTTTQVGVDWVITTGNAAGSAERTFHLDDDPLSNTAGTNRAGMVEIYMRVDRTAAVAYNADSRGAAGGLAVGTTHNWARGKARARVVLTSSSISNVSLGGATPGLFAFPDRTFARSILSATWYRSTTLERRHLRAGDNVQIRNEVGAASTSTQRDYSWTADTGVTAKVLADYPNNAAVKVRLVTPSLPFGGTNADEEYDWAAAGHGSSFSRSSANILENAAAFTTDGRVSINTIAQPIIDGVSTPVAQAVVNYSRSGETYQQIGGTFRLQNARSELLTSAMTAIDRDVRVMSRDIVASADQKNITSSGLISPNASGDYTLPTFTYSGPSSLPRGVGPDGDTAAHDQVGRAKALHIQVNSGNSSYPTVVSSAFVALSDLLRLNVHPQKTTTLIKDTDPYVNPGSGEATSFTIGSDALQMFAFVGTCRGVGKGSVLVNFEYYDPTNAKANTGSNPTRTTTQSPANDRGWTTTNVPFDVKAPAGQWKARVWVDFTSTGSGGNYGDGASNPSDLAALDQIVNFVSSYTADRAVAIHMPDEAGLGIETTIVVEYRHHDGSRKNFDANPSLRIYKVDSANGDETDSLALTQMTRIASLNVWKVAWTPAAAGVYVAEVRGMFTESGVEACETITVRSKIDPLAIADAGTLVDRTGIT